MYETKAYLPYSKLYYKVVIYTVLSRKYIKKCDLTSDPNLTFNKKKKIVMPMEIPLLASDVIGVERYRVFVSISYDNNNGRTKKKKMGPESRIYIIYYIHCTCTLYYNTYTAYNDYNY